MPHAAEAMYHNIPPCYKGTLQADTSKRWSSTQPQTYYCEEFLKLSHNYTISSFNRDHHQLSAVCPRPWNWVRLQDYITKPVGILKYYSQFYEGSAHIIVSYTNTSDDTMSALRDDNTHPDLVTFSSSTSSMSLLTSS